MPPLSAPIEYVKLGLAIDRIFPGYVDAYFGPADLKAQAEAEEAASLDRLAETASRLAETLSSDLELAPDRRSFLEQEVRAMRTTLRILAGEALPFVEEVELLYGVSPGWIEERVFEEAHAVLADILPGGEPLPDRVSAYRQRSRVRVEAAASSIGRLLDELRERTRRLFELPAGEGCDLAFTQDEAWMALNRFLGNGRSRIEFNQDFPIEMWELPTTAAHEAYPGHHSEMAIKEQRLYLGQGRLEHCIALSNNPSSLISEGIAVNALSTVATEAETAALLVDCYARAGLPSSDAIRAHDFARALDRLRSVSDNQLLLLHRDHAPDEEVIDYGVRHGLNPRQNEVRHLRFYKDPLSRSYAYNYTLGGDLVAGFLARSADRRQAFWELLSAPSTPAALRGIGPATSPRREDGMRQRGKPV